MKSINMSLSARRAWIEMTFKANSTFVRLSLSARRAWIEMAHFFAPNPHQNRRSPQGERG